MVLVTPPSLRPSGGHAAAAPERATGDEVLALLRGDASARPRFDTGLAGGLRAWLEDAAFAAVSQRSAGAPPLVLGPRRLLGPAEGARPTLATAAGLEGVVPDDGEDGDRLSDEIVVARAVHALFRQLVHAGTIDDPLTDALDALDARGAHDVVRWVEQRSDAERDALRDTVAQHAARLVALVPRLAPGWLPRTGERVAIPLAGGRIVLGGVFDLLIGVPDADAASLCAVGLSTGGPWPRERRSLHYLALLETLRSGTPPFRLALLDSSSGRYGVEDVREDHLRAMAAHVAAWLSEGGDRGA
jgi:hypothetical protein